MRLPGPRWCGPNPTPNKDLEEFCDAHDIIHVFCTVKELTESEGPQKPPPGVMDRNDGEVFMSLEGMRRWCPWLDNDEDQSKS